MKVVTFGEIMLRLNPQGYGRLLQADTLAASFAGSEANVAVSLASYGLDVEYITKVPDHEMGTAALNSLRRYGVSVAHAVRGGARLGLFYLEKGASQRGGKVIYDRAGSAIAEASHTEFDWETILDGADWLHLTGITPALSNELRLAALEAAGAAKRKGITVSMDLNYRKKLWTTEEATAAYAELLPYVDYCKDPFYFADGMREPEAVAARMLREFDLRGVAITQRITKTANDHVWSATYYTKDGVYPSRAYEMHVVDRVGAGDSFAAGWIYSLLSGYSPEECVEFATAASCLKHSIEGDLNLVTVDEVRALMAGDASGKVRR